MGIPQSLIFLAILFFSYRSFEQVRRRTKHSGPKLVYDAALGLGAGLIGHAVGALTFSAEYQKLFWLVLCLSMCLPALVRGMAAADEKAAVRVASVRSWRTPAISSWNAGSPSQPPIPDDGGVRLKPRAASSREKFKM